MESPRIHPTLAGWIDTHVRARTLAGVRLKAPEGFVYASTEAFLLAHGESFTPGPLPRRYARVRGELGQCYGNAQRIWRASDGQLDYCEGYSLGSVIPMLHAWCVEPDGTVVDPTWAWGTDRFEIEPDAMFGVRFPHAVVRAVLRLDPGMAFSLLDAWTIGWPLYRFPFAVATEEEVEVLVARIKEHGLARMRRERANRRRNARRGRTARKGTP